MTKFFTFIGGGVVAAMMTVSANAAPISNGITLNGITLNGITLNGLRYNRLSLNGDDPSGSKSGKLEVIAVELP